MPRLGAVGVWCAIGASVLCGSHSFAQTSIESSQRSHRRPLSADRPDATESPYTLDAGAIQLEMSFIEYVFNDGSTGTTHAFDLVPFNIKFGLSNSADIQFVLAPVRIVDAPGSTDTGSGDLQVRVKLNLLGNDSGAHALALLPYITLPTGASGFSAEQIEVGLIVPWAVDLGGGWSLGAQVEIASEHDPDTDETRGRFAHTIVVGRALSDRLGIYAEYIGEITLDDGDDYSPAISGGLTWALGPNAQLDVGAVVGLDDGDTDDLRVFTGITLRY